LGVTNDRVRNLEAFELEAEMLVTYQLDLIAQLEYQLRSVHLTMRQIERLRTAKRRVGSEPSNVEKGGILDRLSDELRDIDTELATQHQSCLEMQAAVEKMRDRLRAMQFSQPGSDSPDLPEASSS
jgi:hypothetical protein